MNTIVTLIDFSEITPKLIEQTERFAIALNLPAILLHIVQKETTPLVMEMGVVPPESALTPRREVVAADNKRLSDLVDLLKKAGVDARGEQLVDADVHSALECCEKWNPDLVIVGSHHHSTFYRWLMGSFSSDVLKAAQWPVLVIPEMPLKRAQESEASETNPAWGIPPVGEAQSPVMP